ncbi:MAG: V-type ATP synthase subunit K [Oscillospiraceae bacterium]|nr:V-type ATP synthase subunit K [Oscillospiraceae bacterium]
MQLFLELLPAILVMIGVFLAVVLAGIGSAKGVSMVAKAATALISEQPEKFGQSLVLQMLCATQGLYGFIVGFMIFMNLREGLPFYLALRYLTAGVMIAVSGYVTAIEQAAAATAAMQILAKKPEHSTKGVIYAAMIETYAIFSFVIAVLILM